MWSYYSKHKGICIGLDMEKAQKYLSRMYGKIMIGCSVVEVQYKDIVEKPDYFRDAKDFSIISCPQRQRLGSMNKR